MWAYLYKTEADHARSLQNLERATGLEPATTSLEGWCATNCATPAFKSDFSEKPEDPEDNRSDRTLLTLTRSE